MGGKTRVLIVDDSAIVRHALSEIVNAQPDLEVAGTASDPYVARDKILALAPDVITLDIEMPRMDGLTFLKKLMRFHPMPVIVVSSLGQASSRAAVEALHCGAVDVVAKPGGPYSVSELGCDLAAKIRAAAMARFHAESRAEAGPAEPEPTPRTARPPSLIAMGASTGGVEALRSILLKLPEDFPPVVIVQHIPAVFSTEFARQLDSIAKLRVKEAADGDVLRRGWAHLAPGNFHMTVRKAGGFHLRVEDGAKVQFQRPSVDVLFESVSREAGPSAAGVILTGMGADGAAGLLRMKRAGARTIAQDEASSVVFGMPREAIRAGAVDEILPLERIPRALVRMAGCAQTRPR